LVPVIGAVVIAASVVVGAAGTDMVDVVVAVDVETEVVVAAVLVGVVVLVVDDVVVVAVWLCRRPSMQAKPYRS
jgi:hypothetical protein